jgi:hypothetical protein
MYRQSCCALSDLESNDLAGLPASAVTRFLLPASQYLSEEVGAFQPVWETLSLTGAGDAVLRLPPLLSLTGSVDNDGVAVDSSDLLLRYGVRDNRPAWRHGPYTRIERVSQTPWSCNVDAVRVPGCWGLYDATEATGATVAVEQRVSAETLTVQDGSRVSPGMLLRLQDEAQLVRDYGAPSAGVTSLSAALDALSEVVSLASGAAVRTGEVLRVEFERLKVLDVQSNQAYVVRGWMGSKKSSHASGAAVDAYRTFAVARACNGTTAAIHAAETALLRQMAPSDVVYLAMQIATLMMRKSGTGFAGKTGNAEIGEVFYMHEFPRDEIERIKSNYALVL